MECNAFSRRPSRNASPFQFVGGAITFAGEEGEEERALGERDLQERRFRFVKNEKRKAEERTVEETCILFGLFGRWGRGGGEETHHEDA